MDNNEAWTFSYKSQGGHSTTGTRWHGYVRFLKEDVSRKQSADQLDCMVDCTCPDYRYRWAYNNAKAGAGAIGSDAWNKNNGRAPQPYNNLGEGMCKHLIALGGFLKTNIEPDAPEPEQAPQEPVPIEPVQPSKPQKKLPSSIDAPTPEDPKPNQEPEPEQPEEPDTYSDSRGLTEYSNIYNKLYTSFDQFAKNHPLFEVTYEDD